MGPPHPIEETLEAPHDIAAKRPEAATPVAPEVLRNSRRGTRFGPVCSRELPSSQQLAILRRPPTLSRPAWRVAALYRGRGTLDQGGKGAIRWPRLSCPSSVVNSVRHLPDVRSVDRDSAKEQHLACRTGPSGGCRIKADLPTVKLRNAARCGARGLARAWKSPSLGIPESRESRNDRGRRRKICGPSQRDEPP